METRVSELDPQMGADTSASPDRGRMMSQFETSAGATVAPTGPRDQVFTLTGVDVRYSGSLAVQGVDMELYKNDITAFIVVSVDSSRHYNAFLEHTNAIDEIMECHAITGDALTFGMAETVRLFRHAISDT